MQPKVILSEAEHDFLFHLPKRLGSIAAVERFLGCKRATYDNAVSWGRIGGVTPYVHNLITIAMVESQ